ncbi:MAG TPA: hypothetical protein VLD19_17720, partial [Chitinophagaceae bacterium]|nr:hypothetical protein [Chitinophagaceae bacterium]
MFLRVSLDTGEELEFLMALPPELSHYQVLPNTYTASGEWGQLIFQSFIAKGFSVWYSGCQVKQPIHLHVGAPFETRRFHIVVKNTLDMKPGGLDWLRLKEGQFNITYLPEIDLQLYFEPGDYASFHIHYSADYLQRFTPQLPALGAFLDNTGKGTPCHLCPSHLYASPDMLAAIKSILQNKYIGDLGRIYMESAVITLMAHTIHVIQHENGRSFILTA